MVESEIKNKKEMVGNSGKFQKESNLGVFDFSEDFRKLDWWHKRSGGIFQFLA